MKIRATLLIAAALLCNACHKEMGDGPGAGAAGGSTSPDDPACNGLGAKPPPEKLSASQQGRAYALTRRQ